MTVLVAIFLSAALAAAPEATGAPVAEPNTDLPRTRGTKGPRAAEIVIKGPKGEDLICKTYQPVGSRLPIRACRTAYDWAELNAASLRGMDQMIGHGTYP